MRLIDADKIDFNEVFIGASEFAKDTREAAQSLIDAQPTVEAVPKTYADQIRWERDIAIEQLNEIGCQFGQKMDEVKKKLEASQWIPCSELLPEIKDGEYCSDCVLVTLKWWDGELSETVGWYNNTGIWNEDGKMCKVIAWMPYKPYRQT